MVAKICQDCRIRATQLDLFVSLGLAVFKSVLGFLTGSMAMHAHGLHSLADFLTKGITLVSVKISSRPRSEMFPYGYGKVQYLSSAFVGVSLFGGSLLFLYQNVRHINEGLVEVPGKAAILGAIVGIVAAEIMHRFLKCVADRNNSPAIRSASLDNRMDALSSIAVLVGILLATMGWPVADHLAAILVSLFVARIGATIIYQSVTGLMDVTVPADVLDRIRSIARGVEGVEAVVELRGRKLGELMEIDLIVTTSGDFPTSHPYRLAQMVENGFRHAVAHIDHVHITVVPAEHWEATHAGRGVSSAAPEPAT